MPGTGPFFKLYFIRDGIDPQSQKNLRFGALHNLAVTGFAALLLALATGSQASYGRRCAIVLVAGSIGSRFIQLGDPIWFRMPWDYVRGALIYEMGSWVLLAFIRPLK